MFYEIFGMFRIVMYIVCAARFDVNFLKGDKNFAQLYATYVTRKVMTQLFSFEYNLPETKKGIIIRKVYINNTKYYISILYLLNIKFIHIILTKLYYSLIKIYLT